MSQSDAAAAAASLLATLAEPAFRQSCVQKAVSENAGARALFVELPLAAAVLTGKMMAMTVDRPPEQRFKPILMRLRVLPEAEVAQVSVSRVRAAVSLVSCNPGTLCIG